jgi:hypothetical protein
VDHQKMYEIACAVKPFWDASEKAMANVRECETGAAAACEAWEQSLKVYRDKLLEFAPVIAEATNNSAENIRMLFRYADNGMAWTADDVLNIARYESFNTRLWSRGSGIYRRPTNDYTWPSGA